MTGFFKILTPRRATFTSVPTRAPADAAAELQSDLAATVAASRDWPANLDAFEIMDRLIALDAETPPGRPR